MGTNPEVDAWFAERQPEMEPAMQRVRQIILGTDEGVTEAIKWQTPTFMYEGNICSFNPAKRLVSLLFHRGAEIPGNHPLLEGDGKLARTVRFEDVDAVEAGKTDLEAIIRDWIVLQDST